MTFGSLFAGIGGMDLGLERAGMECCWQVEINERNRRVLAKHWPAAKRYGDIRGVELFDEEGWRQIDETKLEPVDLICGGFPCEDISLASATGVGIIGERSGLWSEFARILAEIRPAFALIENVPALRSRGLALVLQNLHALGFDAEWHCIPASALGAPHQRDRVFIVAYTAGRFERPIVTGDPYDDIRRDSTGSYSWLNADADSLGCDRGGRGDLIQCLRGNENKHTGPTLRPCSGKRSSGANRTEMYQMFQKLPTLTARDWKSGGASMKTLEKNSRPLSETLLAIDKGTMPTLTSSRWSGLQSHGANAVLGPLNPEWCEWYMGFPIGWTELPPSDGSSCRK